MEITPLRRSRRCCGTGAPRPRRHIMSSAAECALAAGKLGSNRPREVLETPLRVVEDRPDDGGHAVNGGVMGKKIRAPAGRRRPGVATDSTWGVGRSALDNATGQALFPAAPCESVGRAGADLGRSRAGSLSLCRRRENRQRSGNCSRVRRCAAFGRTGPPTNKLPLTDILDWMPDNANDWSRFRRYRRRRNRPRSSAVAAASTEGRGPWATTTP
jgi:hypothetical protein